MHELVSLRFVEDHRNVVVLGPVGVGKTFLANALGHLCCRAGFNVRRCEPTRSCGCSNRAAWTIRARR
jgi:DNA replication protein DnaC